MSDVTLEVKENRRIFSVDIQGLSESEIKPMLDKITKDVLSKSVN